MRTYAVRPKRICKANGCQSFQKIGCGGYCYRHRELDPMFHVKHLKAAAKKDIKKIKALPPQPLKDSELVNWYSARVRELSVNSYCENCGSQIPSAYRWASIAHVLPKRDNYGFPSIKTHPLNRVFLGSNCGCHNRYDTSWDWAQQMKIWPDVVRRVIEMFPAIDRPEYKNLPGCLVIEIKKVYPNADI